MPYKVWGDHKSLTVTRFPHVNHIVHACALVKAAPRIQDHFMQFLPTLYHSDFLQN